IHVLALELLLHFLIDRLQPLLDLFVRRRDIGVGCDTVADEPRPEHLPRRRMLGDALIENWLSKRGLVGLVMSVTAVPDDVDEEILTEALPVGDTEAHGVYTRFGVVAVDVQNRDVESLRQVAGVV